MSRGTRGSSKNSRPTPPLGEIIQPDKLTRAATPRFRLLLKILTLSLLWVCLLELYQHHIHPSAAPKRLAHLLSRSEFGYLEELIQACGELCDMSKGRFQATRYFDQRTVSVNCPSIFSDSVFIDRGHRGVNAPIRIPREYRREYTLNGTIPVREWYFDQNYHTKSAKMRIWERELVDAWTRLASRGELDGNYGRNETNHLKSALRHAQIQGGRVLVIGSEIPWVEAVVLSEGAKSIVTLEYGTIESNHPSVQAISPKTFKGRFQQHKLGLFDAVVTFSTVEHSGLGRYGDALNPWGDVLEIARAHCVSKAHGKLVIAVMMTPDYQDALEFNAHRMYGKRRWPYLTTNWKIIHRESSGDQVVHVFDKI